MLVNQPGVVTIVAILSIGCYKCYRLSIHVVSTLLCAEFVAGIVDGTRGAVESTTILEKCLFVNVCTCFRIVKGKQIGLPSGLVDETSLRF